MSSQPKCYKCHFFFKDVTFELSAKGYSQDEAPGALMPVRIVKSSGVLLATPVTFRIVPLTVDEALSQGVITTFQPQNDLSPKRAG